jgi:pimeloyl-ACP methyl ester carboxylesterase
MDLAFRDLGGEGRPPIVFLHGLFGSSQNWVGMGRRLLDIGRILLVDLRNHGDSPHAAEHSLSACVQDVEEWAGRHAPGSLRLIGHSMGGLVAMGFAVAHPDLTAGVVSLDIAPRAYAPEHEAELSAFHLNISRCRSRTELDDLLKPVLPDVGARQFILTNAVREGRGFRWRLNVPALEASTVSSDFANVTGTYEGPALLVAGGRSPYVTREDVSVMHRHFPSAAIKTIPRADHWLQVSAPDALAEILQAFLRGIPSDAISGRVSRL